jgi:hypothetical protein
MIARLIDPNRKKVTTRSPAQDRQRRRFFLTDRSKIAQIPNRPSLIDATD